MTIDVSTFHVLVVTDTCAVWNVLSARALHRAAGAAGCCFSLTEFGLYECLVKTRKKHDDGDRELQRRLRAARESGQFQAYSLDVEDLQDIEVLERRRKLSKGELAAIAFAKKTRQAFLTDDQGARKLAASFMNPAFVQTTPHLAGWLFFGGRLCDSDLDEIVAEHERLGRPLARFLREMYLEAMRCRLLARAP